MSILPQPALPNDWQSLDPVPSLLSRVAAELRADFDFARPVRLARAPGRLDVMGGIADYTGSLVCEATLACGAAVALQERADRQFQVFSFNMLDEHQPFTLRIGLDELANATTHQLRQDLHEPGRRWAGYVLGCLFMLHEHGLIQLGQPQLRGMNLALLSTVPIGGGVSSSAAVEVATMTALAEQLGVRHKLDPMKLASLCQQVEHRIVGAPCGIMDQVTSCAGHAGALLRLICQPHTLLAPIQLPEAIRVVGINSRVRHSVGGGGYGRTRIAAFMGHKIILSKMKEMGEAAGKPLLEDPMRGYLANLDPDDYKHSFRPYLPEAIRGIEFLEKYGPTIDTATTVHPDHEYHVQQATDHHVLEARRVKRFVEFLEESKQYPLGDRRRMVALDKAGHLMYASHISYTNDAKLGADECDVLVRLVRDNEGAGLYGAKITGGGSGGTVAVLCNDAPRAEEALPKILDLYHQQTGKTGQLLEGSSPGAWETGSIVVGG